MSLLRASVAATAAALVVTSSASATESTIYPGVRIGKVELGMTKAQVVRALGKDAIINDRSAGYVELAWNFASWTVGFQDGRAVQVGTTLHTQRTASGTGPGSFWLKLVKAYPGGVCTFTFGPTGGLEYLVPHKGGTQTLFVLHDWPPNSGSYGVTMKTYSVITAYVRRPFRALPEFARDYPYHCRAGWQTEPIPKLP
jgi:hypothetical protein